MGKCNSPSDLDDRKIRKAPIGSKDFRQMTLTMRHGASESIADAIYRIEPQHTLGRSVRTTRGSRGKTFDFFEQRGYLLRLWAIVDIFHQR